jgi:hypothetical protein
MLQPKHMVFARNDDPMQIDKTRFKPLFVCIMENKAT